MRSGSRRRAREGGKWLLLLALIWLSQLAWLSSRIGPLSWREYWHLRGIYRPGIQAVDATGGEYLPRHVFHPLSPGGAKWAFILAAGVYAVLATLMIWGLWRASVKRRREVARSFKRAFA